MIQAVVVGLLTLCAASQTVPSGIQTSNLLLYPLDSASMPDQTFTTAFTAHNYSTIPVFVYGINDYSMGDRFFNEDFESESTAVTSTTFGIIVTSSGPTNIKIFSISFMAIWEPSSTFEGYSYSYASASSISSGSGDRSYQLDYNATQADLIGGLTLLRGWKISSSTDFILRSSVVLTGGSGYAVLVQTGGDCLVQRASLDVLVYVALNASYQVLLDTTGFDSNETSVTEYYRTVTDYESSVFVLAIRGYQGLSVQFDVTFGWRVTANSSTNATIGFNLTNLLSMQYSFLQISQVVVSNNTNGTTIETNSQSTSDSTGLIIGLIVGATGLFFAIFFVFCCVRRKMHSQHKVIHVADKTNLRALPDMSLNL